MYLLRTTLATSVCISCLRHSSQTECGTFVTDSPTRCSLTIATESNSVSPPVDWRGTCRKVSPHKREVVADRSAGWKSGDALPVMIATSFSLHLQFVAYHNSPALSGAYNAILRTTNPLSLRFLFHHVLRTTLFVPRSFPSSASAPGHSWRVRRLFLCSTRAELHGPDAEWSASQCDPGSWSHGQPNRTQYKAIRRRSSYTCTLLLYNCSTAQLQGAIEVKSYIATYCFATHTPEVIGHPFPALVQFSLKPGATLICCIWNYISFPPPTKTHSLFVPLRQLPRIQRLGTGEWGGPTLCRQASNDPF